MAKTIKFNLVCDGKPVRTLEDLQNNFSIEDVLAYYDNGLLRRWLKVRGYEAQEKAVSAITNKDPMEIIKKLISTFNVVAEREKVEEKVYILKYLKEREKRYSDYKQEGYKVDRIIEDYKVGYERLVDGILNNPNDVALIKANIAEIASRYPWILDLNHRGLYWSIKEKSKLAVMCLLMNEKTRNYYLPVISKKEDGTSSFDTDHNEDKRLMYNDICGQIISNDYTDNYGKNGACKQVFVKALGNNLITFSGVTDSYWKDLEPKGKRFMIISMGEGDFVRAAGRNGGDLSFSAIKNRFVILDGIDYKSNSASRQLCYMEV